MKKIHSLKIFRISGKRSKKASTSSKIESIGRQNSFKTLRTREMERKKGASFSSPSAFRFVRCEFPRFNIEMIYIFAGGANGPPQKVAQSERWLHPFSSFLCFSVITTIPSACRRLRSRSTAFTDHVEIRNDSTMMVEEPIGMIGEMKGW